MIDYEVTLDVDTAIADDYLAWLQGHVADMLSLPGFSGATLWRVEDPAPHGRLMWCVRYRLHDQATLERYLTDHAPAMRAEGVARSGPCSPATRRVLSPVSLPS
jgi:hypothetical protein